MSLYQYNAIQWLYLTEYQNMDSQEALGDGADAGTDYDVTTGLSNARGNRCENSHTSGGSATDYVSYRGIENVYGRATQFVDGANLISGTTVYVTNNYSNMIDNTTEGMTSYATLGGSTASYMRDISAGVLFISSSTTGGSSSTYLGDTLYISSGNRTMVVGGSALATEEVGIFYQNYTLSSEGTWTGSGSRISWAENTV
jgi:hypothetical protein